MKRRSRILLVAVLVAGFGMVLWQRVRPSNDRRWVPEQSRVAQASFDSSRVTVTNVRDFDWPADGEPVERWRTMTWDLDRLETVWFVLTPFATNWRGPAHAFLSFGFDDSTFVSISVEARREVGETYSLARGMLKRFEITYIIGTDRDLIGVRALRNRDDVYVYPIRATPEAVRSLFADMIRAADRLAAEPEFYGTLRNNCTTRILDHVNAIVTRRIRYGWRVLLPGYSDELAYDLALIDTTLPLDSARVRYRVNDRVRQYRDEPDFAFRIREITD